MRPLKVEVNGEFSLTNDLTGNLSLYAILSHTWGEDDEEVTFKDLTAGSGKSKTGYKKIQFCGAHVEIQLRVCIMQPYDLLAPSLLVQQWSTCGAADAKRKHKYDQRKPTIRVTCMSMMMPDGR